MVSCKGDTAVDFLGEMGEEIEEFVCAHTLLVNAPADRAWRRRGLLLLCVSRCRKDQLAIKLAQVQQLQHRTYR